MKVTFKSIVLLSFITISLSSCYYDSLEELHPAPIIIPGIMILSIPDVIRLRPLLIQMTLNLFW
jgi:hypothetical protein